MIKVNWIFFVIVLATLIVVEIGKFFLKKFLRGNILISERGLYHAALYKKLQRMQGKLRRHR